MDPKSYFSQLFFLFTSPKEFMKSISKENEYIPILVKLFLLSLVVIVIDGLSRIIITANPDILLEVLTLIFSMMFMFVMPFVVAGMVHLGVLIFKGKQGYYNSFKPIAYGMMIGMVYGLFTGIIFLVWNVIAPMPAQFPLNSPLSFFSFNVVMRLIFGFIVGIISLVHTLYAETVGIALYQKMTNLRAFFSVILIPVILLVLLLVIAILLVMYMTISPPVITGYL